MSQFAERVDAFLDEFFRLYPVSATAAGMHAVDGEWPDLSEAGRAARLAFVDRWEAELRAMPDGPLTADERIDRDLLLSELAALTLRRGRPARGRVGRARLRLPAGRRHLPAARPRLRAARGPADVRGRAPRGRARGACGGRSRAGQPAGSAALASCTPRWRSSSCPGSRSWPTTRWPRPGPRPIDADVAAVTPRLRARRDDRRRRDRGVRGIPARRPAAAFLGRGAARPGAVRPQAAPHLPVAT